MRLTDLRDLFLLAAIWGSSFLFMRLAVHDFGPIAMVEMRVSIAAVFLLIVLAATGRLEPLIRHWRVIAIGGLLGICVPFVCYGYASQHLNSGFMAIVNALAPLFTAIISRLWLGERLTRLRIAGLGIGFGGILILMSDGLDPGMHAEALALAAALMATLFYGIAAAYMTRHFKGLDPIACAAGSVTAAAIVLLPLAVLTWPSQPISAVAWGAAAAIGLGCTGIAYLLFYRLVDNVGPSRTITVTFLVPPFGIFWGAWILDEAITLSVILGAATVLTGTLLATGVIEARRTPD